MYDVKGPGKKVCRGRIFSPRAARSTSNNGAFPKQ